MSQTPAQQAAYQELLIAAADQERAAVNLYLQLAAVAPEADLPAILEILADEQEHKGIDQRLLAASLQE